MMMMVVVMAPAVVPALAIMMTPVSVKFFAINRLRAVIHRWWRVDMALTFVHHYLPSFWFASVIRTQCCSGGAANCCTNNGAVAAIQVMADYCTQRTAQGTTHCCISTIPCVCGADQQRQRQAGNNKLFQHDRIPLQVQHVAQFERGLLNRR